jgi:acid phosphatase family membrane protein YuiD
LGVSLKLDDTPISFCDKELNMTSHFPNLALLAPFTSIVMAQAIKAPLHWLVRKSWNPGRGISTGGMPSSHSAGVTSLATAIGITNGWTSSVFDIAVVVSVITMYDAVGIRRHAGIHATYINRMLKSQPSVPQDGNEVNVLQEMLGHRPIEVVAGAVLGILISVMLNLLIYR